MSGGGYEFTFETHAPDDETTRRIVAHFMVFAMPPEGLREAVSSLWDIIEFHDGRIPVGGASLLGRRSDVLTGRVVEIGDRGPLTLDR